LNGTLGYIRIEDQPSLVKQIASISPTQASSVKFRSPVIVVNMIAKVLPVALLAGAASAACPLSVEITGATNHVVDVAVTNTGSDTITVFKGNTVLSEHATKDLLVADTGECFKTQLSLTTLADKPAQRWQRS
jgi:hypothetical protein